jgi:diacylglycerol kinase family enzyme
MKHIFILNPAAGKGHATTALLPKILLAVKEKGVHYEIHRTVNVGDALRYVRERCAEASRDSGEDTELRFYSCGGDGTMNEVLNGLYGYANAQLSVIPTGTGNDFVRNFENNKDFTNIVKQIEGVPRKIDAIRYELLEPEKNEDVPPFGYALNMFNMGFDAHVVAKAAEIKKKPLMGGTTAYIGGVGAVLVHLNKLDLTVEIDGEGLDEAQYLLAGVANGRFSGGGFDGMPRARVDDGLMDMLRVKSITRRFFLSIVKKYHDGLHLDDPGLKDIIFHYPCKEAVFQPANQMIIAIDGETSIIGGIKFTICPGAINFSAPKNS